MAIGTKELATSELLVGQLADVLSSQRDSPPA